MSQNHVDQSGSQLHHRPVHGHQPVRPALPPPVTRIPGHHRSRAHADPRGEWRHPGRQPAIPAGRVPLGDTPSPLRRVNRPSQLEPPLVEPYTGDRPFGAAPHPLQPITTAEIAEFSARNQLLDRLLGTRLPPSHLFRQSRQPGAHRGRHGVRIGVPRHGEDHVTGRRDLNAQSSAPGAHDDPPRPPLRHRERRDGLLDGSPHSALLSPGGDIRAGARSRCAAPHGDRSPPSRRNRGTCPWRPGT